MILVCCKLNSLLFRSELLRTFYLYAYYRVSPKSLVLRLD